MCAIKWINSVCMRVCMCVCCANKCSDMIGHAVIKPYDMEFMWPAEGI